MLSQSGLQLSNYLVCHILYLYVHKFTLLTELYQNKLIKSNINYNNTFKQKKTDLHNKNLT